MTLERWNKRTWIPYDKDFPEQSDCWEPSFADNLGAVPEYCDCGKPTAVVYMMPVMVNDGDLARILALCSRCAQQLALGILRDVTEANFGEEIANSRYAAMLKKLGKK